MIWSDQAPPNPLVVVHEVVSVVEQGFIVADKVIQHCMG